jgi:hypothetical protein
LPTFVLPEDTTSGSSPTSGQGSSYTPTPQSGTNLQADPTGEFNLFASALAKRDVGQNERMNPRFEILLLENEEEK